MMCNIRMPMLEMVYVTILCTWFQTREERKMEAIMKAFEKLAKREERRKEALARLETTKKPDVRVFIYYYN